MVQQTSGGRPLDSVSLFDLIRCTTGLLRGLQTGRRKTDDLRSEVEVIATAFLVQSPWAENTGKCT
jgi:hypothetical protein